jgi:hypothetical protein
MSAQRFCDRCQQWVPERGLHACVKPKPSPDPGSKLSPAPVSNTQSVSNSVSNRKPSRLQRWRAANLDRYRAYMRAYMRRRRAEAGAL